MTESLTLAGSQRAGSNSKPHHYKQKVQKAKDIPKTWVLRRKLFEDLFQTKKNTSSFDQTTLWKTRPLDTTIEYGPSKQ